MVPDYYERNARTFFEATVDVDMSPIYQRFLPLLPSAARILDAGCGSGRDLRAFSALGFQVTGFDASLAMTALAAGYAGEPVHHLSFKDIVWQNCFEGVWACASLLHVSAAELPDALHRLSNALVPNGILYASFKYGHGQRERGGRRFTDMNHDSLGMLLDQGLNLQMLDIWTTSDQRPGRESEYWLNVLLLRPT